MQIRLLPSPGTQTVEKICQAIAAAGGCAFLVGGAVRDYILYHQGILTEPPQNRDFDIESYFLDSKTLKVVLNRIGRVDTVGEAFQVYKLAFGHGADRYEIDVNLPRQESKTGYGHRGFTITGDPFLSIAAATRRRDFTINAILYNPLTGEIVDPYHGLADINQRTLRLIDPNTFQEDSLRVLRAMQFAARFKFQIDSDTVAVCRQIPLGDLPHERVWGEIEKLLLRAAKPSLGLKAAQDLAIIPQLLPELQGLTNCPPVWETTLAALDEGSHLTMGLNKAHRLSVMLALLLHQLPQVMGAELGFSNAATLLDRLFINHIAGYPVRQKVLQLVQHYPRIGQIYQQRGLATARELRYLALDCEIWLLCLVAKAYARVTTADLGAADWCLAQATSLQVAEKPLAPLLLGRHLLALGIAPGPQIGQIQRQVYQAQLDGQVTDLATAIATAQMILAHPNS
jgi:tRNA nucleotidyltransferase (CCA-adding enzyme)